MISSTVEFALDQAHTAVALGAALIYTGIYVF
jgi:hypothetical protein